jgi:hypothetical protein
VTLPAQFVPTARVSPSRDGCVGDAYGVVGGSYVGSTGPGTGDCGLSSAHPTVFEPAALPLLIASAHAPLGCASFSAQGRGGSTR